MFNSLERLVSNLATETHTHKHRHKEITAAAALYHCDLYFEELRGRETNHPSTLY